MRHYGVRAAPGLKICTRQEDVNLGLQLYHTELAFKTEKVVVTFNILFLGSLCSWISDGINIQRVIFKEKRLLVVL